MEAKDTKRLLFDEVHKYIKDASNITEEVYDALEAQAGISFKAGIKEVVEWIESEGRVGNQYWHSLLFPTLLVDTKKWQAKLEEWGIREIVGKSEPKDHSAEDAEYDWKRDQVKEVK